MGVRWVDKISPFFRELFRYELFDRHVSEPGIADILKQISVGQFLRLDHDVQCSCAIVPIVTKWKQLHDD